MDTTAPRPVALVVDDDYAFSEYLRMVLESMGWRAIVCQEPLEAWDMAVREKPDLVLMDLVMPQMSGLEVLVWFKDRPQTKDIPVVLCSVNMDRKVALEVAALGGVEALAKPLSKQELVNCLQRVRPAGQSA